MGTQPEDIVWGREGSPRCAAVKEALAGRNIEFRQIEEVWAGRDPHCVHALAQLAFQNGELPVVLLDGKFVEPRTILPGQCAAGGGACVAIPRHQTLKEAV